MKKLGDIATIKSGYTFREALSGINHGSTLVFQAKDISNYDPTTLISIKFASTDHYLQNGDVLLSIRGSFKAMAFKNTNKKTIASSSVMVIRPNLVVIQSEYLALYLNSPRGQDQLRSVASGAVIKSITKPELANITIPIPPPDIQQTLANLANNINTQQKMINKKQQIIDKILNNSVKSLTKGK